MLLLPFKRSCKDHWQRAALANVRFHALISEQIKAGNFQTKLSPRELLAAAASVGLSRLQKRPLSSSARRNSPRKSARSISPRGPFPGMTSKYTPDCNGAGVLVTSRRVMRNSADSGYNLSFSTMRRDLKLLGFH